MNIKYVPPEEFRRIETVPDKFERTALFSNLARINTLYMIMKAGSGHIGSSFSSLDIVSWLYCEEMRIFQHDGTSTCNNDIYFSSKGHDVPGLYAVLTGLGLLDFDMIHRLRRINGLPGHPDISTPMIVTNTGSLGMGISKAKGFVIANRMQGKPCRVFVLTGDGELQEGQIWESLMSASSKTMHELVMIVDNNRFQSDFSVKNTSDIGKIEEKFRSFGWNVMNCDGHDLRGISKVMKNIAGSRNAPSVIIADTIKGCGVSFMESDSSSNTVYEFHSGAPTAEQYNHALYELVMHAEDSLEQLGMTPLKLMNSDIQTPIKQASVEKVGVSCSTQTVNLPASYSEILLDMAETCHELVVLDADLRKDCGLMPFADRYPSRFIECGIAEQDMVSQAGALALKGFLPIVHSFASFLPSRACDQIYNNTTEQTKIIYTGTLAGVLPGGPGHSHQAVRDIALLSHLPAMTIIEPCCETELREALNYAVHINSGSTYLRLCSLTVALPFNDLMPLESPGKGVVVREGHDAIIFTYGPVMLAECHKAVLNIEKRYDLSIAIVNHPWLNCLDTSWFTKTIRPFDTIFTVDNHYIHGGIASLLGLEMACNPICQKKRLVATGLTDIPVCGTNEEVLAAHSLDAKGVADSIENHLQHRL